MPRDGSNIYHYPPGIEGEPDQIILSADYNSFISDVEQDLNLPRPILAGGTGAVNADAALAALRGERSKQGPVTNYDSFPWVNGSFFSDAGATGAPTPGDPYTGIYYEHFNPLYATIEARKIASSGIGELFIRQKTAGVWGAWTASDAALNAAKVNRTGDTMTGNLTISTTSYPALTLNKGAGVSANQIVGTRNGLQRWLLRPGNDDAETGGSDGSNFDLHYYADNGTLSGRALRINRINGLMEVIGDPVQPLHVVTKQYSDLKSNNATQIVSSGGTRTTVLTDAQKCIVATSGLQLINNGLAYPLGTTISFAALGGNITVNTSSGSLFFNQGGTILTGVRTISNTGIATAIKLNNTDWVISGGSGIT